MYQCTKCKETFNYRDEVAFLCGENEVQDEEHGGSGDIDEVLCVACYGDIEVETIKSILSDSWKKFVEDLNNNMCIAKSEWYFCFIQILKDGGYV
ncbi:MAG: hypothetical protein ACRDD7_11550 [Peptostreptococcaceae bacterium]